MIDKPSNYSYKNLDFMRRAYKTYE